MKKLFLGIYKQSNLVTFIGLICSITGISMLLSPSIVGNHLSNVSISMILLILAGIFDMFDGSYANRFKRTEKEKEFGVQLDSLADTISFVVFPIILLLKVMNNSLISLIIAIFYACAGVIRLGYFNITKEENNGYFIGLPVTFSAVIFPTLYLFLQLLNFNYYYIIMPIAFLITAFAFILNFKFKKPGLKFSFSMLLFAFFIIAGYCLL